VAEGVRLDGIYFCPHHPEEDCACRKPATGMAERAGREMDFDPAAGFVIGDNTCDIRMGERLNATTFLVRTGYGLEISGLRSVRPDYVVDDIAEAARAISANVAQEEVCAKR
jgi:histidinol phosphatase-like enzyme